MACSAPAPLDHDPRVEDPPGLSGALGLPSRAGLLSSAAWLKSGPCCGTVDREQGATMLRSTKRTAAALVTTLALASTSIGAAAHASIVTQTYRGTILSGTDEGAGFFGRTDLTGQLFSATYVFDDELGTRTLNSVEGGVPGLGPSPDLSTTVTIGGRTLSFKGDFGQFTNDSVSNRVSSNSSSPDIGTPFFYSAALSLEGLTVPESLDTPFSGTGSTSIFTLNGFTFANSDTGELAFGSFDPTSIDVTVTSAAPEPDIWALMLAGVGFMGAALRLGRRRQPLASV